MEKLLHWIEAHPWAAGGIGAAVVLLVWFVFGGSSSGSSGSSAGSDLAGAYYAAEQANTVAGTQLQIATVQANAATAQQTIQANAAEAIAATGANLQSTLGRQQLTATESNNETTIGTNASNNFYNWLSRINVLQSPIVNNGTFSAVTVPGEFAGTR